MTDKIEINKGISQMYARMSEVSMNIAKAIEEDIEKYNIVERAIGYELKTGDGRTYQLVLELKKIE